MLIGNNNIMSTIKSNPFVRGVFMFLKTYFGNRRNSYGLCGENVLITPPIYVDTPKNVFLLGQNEDQYNTYRINSRKIAEEKLSQNVFIEKYLKLLESKE